MQKLLIATSNPAKLNEIKLFLKDMDVQLLGLEEAGITERAEETGSTFEENAVLKAKFYAQKSQLPTLADDGGFEIDALGGEPGVKSHRWIHGEKDNEDEELIQYTIMKMKGLPRAKRGAQLRLVLALVLPDGTTHTAEASIRGIVPDTPSTRRTAGFPFRSLLYLPDIGKFYDHRELTLQETEAYNHRKRALEKLKPVLIKYYA